MKEIVAVGDVYENSCISRFISTQRNVEHIAHLLVTTQHSLCVLPFDEVENIQQLSIVVKNCFQSCPQLCKMVVSDAHGWAGLAVARKLFKQYG